MNEGKEFSYTIEYTKAAEKFMKTHEDVRQEYESAIEELLFGDHPEKVDVKRIVGKRNDYYRIRIRNWRIIYAVINGVGFVPAPLGEKGAHIHRVGDCVAVGNLRTVVWRAWDVCMRI